MCDHHYKNLEHHRRVYNYNRSIMLTLGDSELATTYPILQLSDCTVSTAITDPNSRQSCQRLPWFWSAARPGTVEGDEDARFVECKCQNRFRPIAIIQTASGGMRNAYISRFPAGRAMHSIRYPAGTIFISSGTRWLPCYIHLLVTHRISF